MIFEVIRQRLRIVDVRKCIPPSIAEEKRNVFRNVCHVVQKILVEEEAMKPPSRHHPPCAVIVKSCFKDSRSMSQALHHPLPSWCVPSIPGIERSLFAYTTNDISGLNYALA
ncbi:hypothetical protein RchiOBHm_Chr2g0157431 [Rosa chinensis]|uniref:Uncharacterized protein n=1 Tax=Rosa chinensis TaxID=74649 RepID=A0A2P6S1U0_ROSCH|nr:hypothetical protein RchiOBHm_Chr2g0157431 [Rosa chinensis]